MADELIGDTEAETYYTHLSIARPAQSSDAYTDPGVISQVPYEQDVLWQRQVREYAYLISTWTTGWQMAAHTDYQAVKEMREELGLGNAREQANWSNPRISVAILDDQSVIELGFTGPSAEQVMEDIVGVVMQRIKSKRSSESYYRSGGLSRARSHLLETTNFLEVRLVENSASLLAATDREVHKQLEDDMARIEAYREGYRKAFARPYDFTKVVYQGTTSPTEQKEPLRMLGRVVMMRIATHVPIDADNVISPRTQEQKIADEDEKVQRFIEAARGVIGDQHANNPEFLKHAEAFGREMQLPVPDADAPNAYADADAVSKISRVYNIPGTRLIVIGVDTDRHYGPFNYPIATYSNVIHRGYADPIEQAFEAVDEEAQAQAEAGIMQRLNDLAATIGRDRLDETYKPGATEADDVKAFIKARIDMHRLKCHHLIHNRWAEVTEGNWR
ncbi:MAG: hypothetical protein AAF085_16060 [Planctomycetota bacterium]